MLAARFLEARGLRVLQRNYRCRSGEIDIVALDGRTLVFAEVRYRSSPSFNTVQIDFPLAQSRSAQPTGKGRNRWPEAARHCRSGSTLRI
jgi:hypothetical protein